MVGTVEIFAKPIKAIWQFFMADKPQIIDKVELPHSPNAAGLDYIYTVRLPEGHFNRMPGQDTRQVHRMIDREISASYSNYTGLFLILPEFEGDKFKKAPFGTKVYSGLAAEDVVLAVKAYEELPAGAKKKTGIEPVEPTGTRHCASSLATHTLQ